MDLSEDLLDEYIETGEEVEAENEQLLTVFLNGEEQEEEEKTIIQAKDLTSDFFLNLHTKSFICLEPAPSSKSTFWKDLINFFPPLTDVGIDKAIYLEPLEIVEDDIGVEIYVKSCKKLEIYPMTRIINSLPTKILNLKYYYLDLKQMRALTDALLINKQVKELIFQDSFLTPEQVQLISEILELNHNITILNLRGCKIGPEGAEQLAPGLDITLSLKDLDLSFNYIKDEGFKHIHESIRTNNSIVNLNLSHNELAEDSAPLFAELFKNNMSIQNLDLSWNFFFNGPANKKMFKTLAQNETIKWLNMSWNGISTRLAILGIVNSVIKNNIEYLDVSNNRITGPPIIVLRRAIVKSEHLQELRAGNNPMTPDEVQSLANGCLQNRSKFKILDLENICVNKTILPLKYKIEKQGKTIKYGLIYSNYQIFGPDVKKMLMARANFLAMKPKKKKRKRNFGHFILGLPDTLMKKDAFRDLVKQNKIVVNPELITDLMKEFQGEKKKVDCVAMKEYYLKLWPDTVLPPPPPEKKKKGKKGKKEKKKKEQKPKK